MNLTPELLESVSDGLSPRGREFLKRVYSGGLDKFVVRLKALGFDRLGSVLDAGCGFGQWSLAMASQGVTVSGVDNDTSRIAVANKLALDIDHCQFQTCGIENLPFEDASFDGVFCYSAIYYADVEKVLREFFRVLRPGGLLYICSNGPGWALYNLIHAPNPTPDFNPRHYAMKTCLDSLRYATMGTPPSAEGSLITSINGLTRKMEKLGGKLITAGGEGTIQVMPNEQPPSSFFKGRYLGLEAVSEWLARKEKA